MTVSTPSAQPLQTIPVGQSNLPAPVVKQPEQPQEQATPSQLAKGDDVQLQSVTVKKGDTLWALAETKLGDPKKWPSIFAQNRDQIKDPNLIYPGQVLTIAQPAPPVQQPVQQPAQPEQPVQQPEPPAQPQPVQQPEQPAQPPAEPVLVAPPTNLPVPAQPAQPVVVGNPPSIVPTPATPHNASKTLKVALVGGTVGTIGTAGTLIAMTARLAPPAANLGGYATAQTIARGLASVGLKVPQGPALTKLISSVGGPKVAGAAAAVGVGLAVAGVAAGGYYLYNKMTEPTPAAK